MIVTTAGRTNEAFILKAKEAAIQLGIPYIPRQKKSISFFLEKYGETLVIGKNGMEIHSQGKKEPFFFHPNMAMVRIKRLDADEHDVFIDVTGLQEGSSILDCTLGYASDSIVASYIVGESGKVTGLEANSGMAYVVKAGLDDYNEGSDRLKAAMRRIEVVNADHYSHLRTLPDDSYDVVYFDPMFEQSIEASSALQAIGNLAVHSGLEQAVIDEAKRVARSKVVLKDHYKSARFEQFGFKQQIRKTSKFHFGIIDL